MLGNQAPICFTDKIILETLGLGNFYLDIAAIDLYVIFFTVKRWCIYFCVVFSSLMQTTLADTFLEDLDELGMSLRVIFVNLTGSHIPHAEMILCVVLCDRIFW